MPASLGSDQSLVEEDIPEEVLIDAPHAIHI